MKRLVFTQVRPDYLWDGETGDSGDESVDDEAPSAFRVRWLVESDDWYKTPAVGWIPRLYLVH
jgi:hypothetical protein